MSGTRDINDPSFFDTGNLDALGEPARLSDFGPGPNESPDYARNQSAMYRQALSEPQAAVANPVYANPYIGTTPAPVEDTSRIDALEAKIDMLLNKLGGNQ